MDQLFVIYNLCALAEIYIYLLVEKLVTDNKKDGQTLSYRELPLQVHRILDKYP